MLGSVAEWDPASLQCRRPRVKPGLADGAMRKERVNRVGEARGECPERAPRV